MVACAATFQERAKAVSIRGGIRVRVPTRKREWTAALRPMHVLFQAWNASCEPRSPLLSSSFLVAPRCLCERLLGVDAVLIEDISQRALQHRFGASLDPRLIIGNVLMDKWVVLPKHLLVGHGCHCVVDVAVV